MRGIGILVVLCVLITMQAMAADTAPSMDQVKRIQHEMAVENAMNVGQVLPRGVQVLQTNGDVADLRDLLHGPTTLIKVKPKNCPPCEQLLAFVHANAASFTKVQKANIVVLMIDSAATPDLPMPPNVTVLHTHSAVRTGFLGGELTPTVFFFDASHRLIARSAGLVSSPEHVLQFPTTKASH